MPIEKQKPRLQRSTLSVGEFCIKYGLGRTKVYELITEQKVDSYLIGRRRFICAKSARKLKKQAIKQGSL